MAERSDIGPCLTCTAGVLLALWLGSGTPAAAQSFAVTAVAPAQDEDLPVPPIPPPTPPRFAAAPTGQSAEAEPDAPDTSGTRPRFRPSVFARASIRTDGYLEGSTVQDQQDHRPPPAGVKLSLPLAQ